MEVAPQGGAGPEFRSTFRVRSYELDALRHVNHAVFLNYFEQARVDALEKAGFPWGELLERGWLFNVVHVEVDFRAEARLEDTVLVDTSVEKVGNTSMTLQQVAHRRRREEDPPHEPPTLLATARIVGVMVGPEGRPIRLPDEMRTAFTPG